jgi:cyclase
MLETRVMPCLLLKDGGLVKTVKFREPDYVGDPINAVRIFNELEVDELVFLDIGAARTRAAPDFALISRLATECFMPFTYGGGVASIEHIRLLQALGIERVALNTAALECPELVADAARVFGSQAIVVSIDVSKPLLGQHRVYGRGGGLRARWTAVEWARQAEKLGAGEILLTSIDRDGTWSGYDLELVRSVVDAVNVPVIACGGAGTVEHLEAVVRDGGASAVAIGSMVVYQKRGFGVLINFPTRDQLRGVRAAGAAGEASHL